MIPDFTLDGFLPPGVHEATWEEFCNRFGGNEHRLRLLRGLNAALTNLWNAGCQEVYIDGSFVTNKELPRDFDGCWEIVGVDPELLDPILLDFDDGRLKQKLKYGGELFPAYWNAVTSITYLDFFQNDKHTGKTKGIILLKPKK